MQRMSVGNIITHVVPIALSVALPHSEWMPSFSDTFVLTSSRYAQGDYIRRIPEQTRNGLKVPNGGLCRAGGCIQKHSSCAYLMSRTCHAMCLIRQCTNREYPLTR